MAKPPSKNPLKHVRASDLRGIAQLATQATAGVTGMVEGVHQSVLETVDAPAPGATGPVSGITRLVYKAVNAISLVAGKSADVILAGLQPLFEAIEGEKPDTPQREAVLAALNGVMGDRLLAGQSQFATPMTLRYRGEELNPLSPTSAPEPDSKVMLFIHGLCMNDLQWRLLQEEFAVSHAEEIEAGLGHTPVYLRYNSGLHTSENGRELAGLLEQFVANWPSEVEELSVVAHSMGGLLIRSACYYAEQEQLQWPEKLENIVFLGTPHHGAPLERAGNWLDIVLGSTPYTAPFTKLAQLRSAGITDLRYGHVLDQDWHGRDRFDRDSDNRQPVPLPDGVACYTVAATTAARRSALADHLVGDGLVPLRSALGQHEDKTQTLGFKESSRRIAYRMNHMDLLSSPDVARQIVEWFRPG